MSIKPNSIGPVRCPNDVPRFMELMRSNAQGRVVNNWEDLSAREQDSFLRALHREKIPLTYVGQGCASNVTFAPRLILETGRTVFMVCNVGSSGGSDITAREIAQLYPTHSGQRGGI